MIITHDAAQCTKLPIPWPCFTKCSLGHKHIQLHQLVHGMESGTVFCISCSYYTLTPWYLVPLIACSHCKGVSITQYIWEVMYWYQEYTNVKVVHLCNVHSRWDKEKHSSETLCKILAVHHQDMHQFLLPTKRIDDTLSCSVFIVYYGLLHCGMIESFPW